MALINIKVLSIKLDGSRQSTVWDFPFIEIPDKKVCNVIKRVQSVISFPPFPCGLFYNYGTKNKQFD